MTDDPAFPLSFAYSGLTKRELFAAMAMQGDLANGHVSAVEDRAADYWVYCADALIAALSKGPM